jgi:Flp pilus assembly protein TadD
MSSSAYAYYLDGKLAAYRSDWDAAVDSLREAAKVAPDQPMIAVELARALSKAKKDVAARETLAEARKKWPDHPQVWRVSGDLLAGSAKPEAIRAYQRAIELSPDDEEAYLGLAKLQPEAGAESTLRELVDKLPASVEGHYRLAVRLYKKGQLAQAISSLRRVLERDPDHLDARLDLARALRRTGDLAQAIEQTRSAFDRSGQALDIAEELYWLLCEADDRTAAIDLLTLLDDDRSDVDALAAVARLERGLGRVDQARAIANRVAIVDTDAGTLLHAELDAPADPAGVTNKLLAISADSPRFGDARRLAAQTLLAAGDAAGALAAITPAREANPKDLEIALVALYARADSGDVAGAKTQAARLGSGLGPTIVRARFLDHVGDTNGALALLEPLLVDHPDSTTVLNLAGYMLADANRRLPDAQKWLARARELAPGDPAILDSWGWLLVRQGKHREAVRILDRAARFSPREPEILFHLATAWVADGAPRTARTILDHASTLHPTPAVRKRIDALRATLPAPR